MKKKLIELDPSQPPLYPLINVLQSLAEAEMRPLSNEDKQTFEEDLCQIIGVKDYAVSSVILPDEINGATRVVDFSIGKMENINVVLDQKKPMDLSGLPAFSFDLSSLESNKLFYTIDQKMGINEQMTFVLEKGGTDPNLPFWKEHEKEIKFIHKLLIDYKLQKDNIVRDLKYKSALIQNFLEHPKLIRLHFDDIPFPSPAFGFAIDEGNTANFVKELEKSGYEIGVISNKNGNDHFVIANFINHSKEQIERFIDQMVRILSLDLL